MLEIGILFLVLGAFLTWCGKRIRHSQKKGDDLRYDLLISKSQAEEGAEVTISYPYTDGFSQYKDTSKIKIPRTETFKVETGTKLRIQGGGNIHPSSRKRGDLYIFLKVENHQSYDDAHNEANSLIQTKIVQCRFCGANSKIEIHQKFSKCEYCGQEIH